MSTAAVCPTPLISVIIPTLRSAALLPGALDSLAVQTCRDFEVAVCDGCSDDGTADIALKYTMIRSRLLTLVASVA